MTESVTTTESVATTDGRVLRGERTRRRIVQALLDLINDGVREPTASQIAQRAEVSVRSVFQHFSDIEALYEDLASEQRGRIAPLLASLERPADLADRIDALVAQRRNLFEAIAPVRHAIGGRAVESPALRARLDELSAALRSQLADQFDDELTAINDTQGEQTLHALDVVCSFEAWDRMREYQRLDAEGAAAVMQTAVAALLPH